MSLFTILDYLLFVSSILILAASVYLTFRLRFVQIRLIPQLFKMLKDSTRVKSTTHTISPIKALFTAMSTTLGLTTIVGPVMAISVGGPGALFGFLLMGFFGSAATYAEVNLCIRHRMRRENGTVIGGPMSYIKHILSPGAAKWYAACCMLVMIAWSSAQANQLAAILDSPLLGNYRIPTLFSGALISILVLLALFGGIKRIGSFSAKLVPIMFTLYLGSSLWIILSNTHMLGPIFAEMFHSALKPYPLASGALIGGLVTTLRWGIFKGTQCTEAGVGTQTIPHSMAETSDPVAQGTIAMLSTYSAGFIAFISGCVALITKTWLNTELPLGISMVAASYQQYFSFFGIAIVAISSFLFGFGTILGNNYNGSVCFSYLSDNRNMRVYLFATTVVIFIGTISDAKTIWSAIDIFLVFMVLPHIFALVKYAHKKPEVILDGSGLLEIPKTS